jgi:putative 4-mercaptohistidine N1-methyltranferase
MLRNLISKPNLIKLSKRLLSTQNINVVRSTSSSGSGVYESKRAVYEYLLTHYGHPKDQMPYSFGPIDALNFPARSAQYCIKHKINLTGDNSRALDVGCAVGGASFELAKHFKEVVGIDFSNHFVDAANEMKLNGKMDFEIMKQGNIFQNAKTTLNQSIDRNRVHFEQGDACNLNENLGKFDLILASNLLCRLPSPKQFIDSIPKFLNNGGSCVLISPYSWLEEYTPLSEWIGAQETNCDSFTELKNYIKSNSIPLKLVHEDNMDFLIREHERKFQYGVSHCSVWKRI